MCEIVLLTRKNEVERLAQFVERFGADRGLSDTDVMEINLVLDEIVLNVIRHGHDDEQDHEIRIGLGAAPDTVTITVEDDGKPFNPLDAPPPDLDLPLDERPIGGLGIHIMRSLTSALEYRRDGGKNRLTLTKPRRS